ncbi:MAG: hypothetical protein V2B18_15205 [Pseudomonadota bacterium]
MATSIFLLAPADPVAQGGDKKQRKEFLRWEKKVGNIIHYQGGYKSVSGLPRGVSAGYVSHRSSIDDFKLGEYPGDSLEGMIQLAEAYPGEYLAVWTYGHAIHAFHLSTANAGVSKEMSLRLSRACGRERDPKLIDGFLKWFDPSSFQPDSDALRLQFRADEISVNRWFSAFGVEGAPELSNPNKNALWEDFEKAAPALLGGETPERALLDRINALILDPESRLAAEVQEWPGGTARHVHGAAYDLAEVIGEPDTGIGKERLRAARFYWDITDCESAVEHLTVGVDEKGFGSSASLGRLLCYYPVELRRDPIFLAYAGMEAEGANGHAFVEPFHCLAEHAAKAGFWLAVYPEKLSADFRRAFGMESEWEEAPTGAKEGWGADAFVDIPGVVSEDPSAELETWYATNKADGMLLRAEADGSFRITRYLDGSPSSEGLAVFADFNTDRLARACRDLDPKGVFDAFNLPDLLEPGEWTEGAYAGEKPDPTAQCAKSVEIMAKLQEPVRIGTFKEILKDFPGTIRYKTGKHGSGRQEALTVRITLSEPDEAYLQSLLEDLKCGGLLESYGHAWIDGPHVWGFSYSDINASLFVRVLADMPSGTRVAIDVGGRAIRHYVLDGDAAADDDLFRSCPAWIAAAEAEASRIEPDDDENDDEDDESAEGSDDEDEGDGNWDEFDFMDGIDVDHESVGDIIWERGERIFFQVDMDKTPLQVAELVGSITDRLSAAGFKHLGDLVCNEYNSIVVRMFAAADERAYAAILAPLNTFPAVELVSYFDDRSSLATTTNITASHRPDLGLHRRIVRLDQKNRASSDPWEEVVVRTLMDEHKAALAEFEAERKRVIPVDATLLGVAKALDESIDKELRAAMGL